MKAKKIFGYILLLTAFSLIVVPIIYVNGVTIFLLSVAVTLLIFFLIYYGLHLIEGK